MTPPYFYTALTFIKPLCATVLKLHTKKSIQIIKNVVFVYKSEKIRLKKIKDQLSKQFVKKFTKNTPQ